MNNLNLADYAVIGGYFCVLMVLGLWFRNRAASSLEDYFLAGRSMPWWAMGISGMASYIDMAGTMLIVSFLYMLGPRGLYIEFRGGAVLVLTFMMLWSGKWHYRSGCMTGAEWMEYRFGKGWGGQAARLLSAFAVIVTTVGMLGYMIKALGLFASMFLPFPPAVCALLIIGLATLYTLASGFYGVVLTDMFQSAMVVSAVFLISILAITRIAGVEDLGALALRVTGDAQWTTSAMPWTMPMPRGYEQYSDLMVFAFFYLLRNALIGMSSAGADPKFFGARSERECGMLGMLWTSLMVFRWPMMIGFALLGLVLVDGLFPNQGVVAQSVGLIKTAVPDVTKERWTDLLVAIQQTPEKFSPGLLDGLRNLLNDNWQAKVKLLSFDGTINPENIVPAVILFYLPQGVRGFLVVAFVAAALSVFNSTVNTTAAYFTRDIFQRYLRPRADHKKLLTATHVFTVLLVGSGFLLAYFLQSINQVWGWVIMSLGGGIAIPSVLKFYWWRMNGAGFAIGTGAGILAALLQIWLLPGLNEWQQFVLVGSISLLGTVAGTLLWEPAEEAVLEHFYRTTRPFGFWGPYKRALQPAALNLMEREHRNDLLAVPFTLGWQITLFLLPMQAMVRSWKEFEITLMIFLSCLVGMYWFWYRNLPPRLAWSPAMAPHKNRSIVAMQVPNPLSSDHMSEPTL